MTRELDKRISRRIDTIAQGRTGNRDDLHEHVLAEAEAQAAGGPITDAHLDAAFATLGDDEQIRTTFFNEPSTKETGATVPRWAIALYALAALIASIAILSTRPETFCELTGGATECRSVSAGGEFDLLVFGLPPLIVLATHFVGPRWLPLFTAAVWSALFGLPATTGGGWAPVGMPIAVAITIGTALIVWRKGRT